MTILAIYVESMIGTYSISIVHFTKKTKHRRCCKIACTKQEEKKDTGPYENTPYQKVMQNTTQHNTPHHTIQHTIPHHITTHHTVLHHSTQHHTTNKKSRDKITDLSRLRIPLLNIYLIRNQ